MADLYNNKVPFELKTKSMDESIQGNAMTLKRPENWGGYIVEPVSFEFWQGRDNRLHDRIRYKLRSNTWDVSRLAP